MGCVGSKTPDHSPLASPGKKSPHKKGGGGASGEERKEYSWDKKAALNPEDFVLRKMSGQTLVREPGYAPLCLCSPLSSLLLPFSFCFLLLLRLILRWTNCGQRCNFYSLSSPSPLHPTRTYTLPSSSSVVFPAPHLHCS